MIVDRHRGDIRRRKNGEISAELFWVLAILGVVSIALMLPLTNFLWRELPEIAVRAISVEMARGIGSRIRIFRRSGDQPNTAAADGMVRGRDCFCRNRRSGHGDGSRWVVGQRGRFYDCQRDSLGSRIRGYGRIYAGGRRPLRTPRRSGRHGAPGRRVRCSCGSNRAIRFRLWCDHSGRGRGVARSALVC